MDKVVFSIISQAPDKHHITPLLSAVYEGHVSCVKLLLSKVRSITFYYLFHCCVTFHLSICLIYLFGLRDRNIVVSKIEV